VGEQVVGNDTADGEERPAGQHPADPIRRDVEQHQHCAEDQQREAEVLVEDQRADGDSAAQQVPTALQQILSRGRGRNTAD